MKEINLDSFSDRTRRKLKKSEPYISKILYLTTFTIFSIENFLIFPNFSVFLFFTGREGLWDGLFDSFVIFYFILFLAFILSLPLYFYNAIKGKIPSSKVRLFEMLSSLVLFIGSSVNNFIPKNICIIFMGNCYPGAMIVGIITLFIILSLTTILERGYKYPREKKYSKLTNQDFKRIDTSLNEEIYRIRDEIQENLELILKETREIFETLNWDYMKFTFKRLEKYSNLIEELFLCYRQSHFLDFYNMKLFRTKGLIDDGEFEEGIKLLRTLIIDLPSESEEYTLYGKAKKQHVLAVYLAKTHQYKDAYNIFMEILKNLNLVQVRRTVNFDVLGKVLENHNYLKASVAAKEKNYELLYSKLGLEAYYHPPKIIHYIYPAIAMIAVIGLLFLLIFLFIWWYF